MLADDFTSALRQLEHVHLSQHEHLRKEVQNLRQQLDARKAVLKGRQLSFATEDVVIDLGEDIVETTNSDVDSHHIQITAPEAQDPNVYDLEYDIDEYIQSTAGSELSIRAVPNSPLPPVREVISISQEAKGFRDSVKSIYSMASEMTEVTEVDHEMTSTSDKRHSLALRDDGKLDVILSKDNQRKFEKFENFVEGPFDIIMGTIILGNTLMMTLQLEWYGRQIGVKMGIETEFPDMPGVSSAFESSEHIFNTIYLCEFVFRIIVLQRRYFRHMSNLLDAFIILSTIVNTYILHSVNGKTTGMYTLRIVRCVRVVRVLRVLRTFKLFRPLRILVRTISASILSLFWSMAILSLLILMSAIFLCQTLQGFLNDENANLSHDHSDAAAWIYNHYGTTSRSVWTTFQATFSGGWPAYVDTVIEEVSWLYCIYFAVYVYFVVFATLRIIAALFLKETLAMAASDAETQITERQKQASKYLKKLAALFHDIDTSGDGFISIDEFCGTLNSPEARAYFAVLDVPIVDVAALFNILNHNGDGFISYSDFTTGIVRIKGNARAMDVVAVQQEISKISRTLAQIKSEIGIQDANGNARSSKMSSASSKASTRSRAMRVCTSILNGNVVCRPQ